MDHLEEETPEKAAERFCEIMIEMKADPQEISLYIDKIIERNKDKK